MYTCAYNQIYMWVQDGIQKENRKHEYRVMRTDGAQVKAAVRREWEASCDSTFNAAMDFSFLCGE